MLLTICLGYFMVILDTMVVNVAVPSLGHDLHTGVSALQWVVAAYTLVFAGLLLSAGTLGDRVGPKRVLRAGLVVFTLASAACALAPTVGFLIAARLAQGAGAALFVPASLMLLQALYAEPRQRAHAFGMWGGVAGIAAASGPIVGGLLISGFGWRSVFLVNVPIGFLTLAGVARLPDVPGHPRRADIFGQILGIATLAALTAALIETSALGWIAAVVLAIAFFYTERRSPVPHAAPHPPAEQDVRGRKRRGAADQSGVLRAVVCHDALLPGPARVFGAGHRPGAAPRVGDGVGGFDPVRTNHVKDGPVAADGGRARARRRGAARPCDRRAPHGLRGAGRAAGRHGSGDVADDAGGDRGRHGLRSRRTRWPGLRGRQHRPSGWRSRRRRLARYPRRAPGRFHGGTAGFDADRSLRVHHRLHHSHLTVYEGAKNFTGSFAADSDQWVPSQE